MLCLNCLRNLDNGEKCECGSGNILRKKGRKYIHSGQAYSEKKWLALLASNRLQAHPSYREEMYRKNIRINTITRLFLPALFLLLLSFGTGMFLLLGHDRLHPNSVASAAFIALVFLLIALINLKRIFFDKVRVVAEMRGRRMTYRQMRRK